VWGLGALLFGLGSGDRKFVARRGQETREREKTEGEKECAKKEKLLQLVMQFLLLLLLLSFFFFPLLLLLLLGPSSPVPRDNNALTFR
jgi:hypothetical protein